MAGSVAVDGIRCSGGGHYVAVSELQQIRQHCVSNRQTAGAAAASARPAPSVLRHAPDIKIDPNPCRPIVAYGGR